MVAVLHATAAVIEIPGLQPHGTLSRWMTVDSFMS